MNDKTLDISALSSKIFNLLDYLEQNCINLMEINYQIISVNPKNQNAIKKNISSIEVVFNRVLAIREELETNIKEQLIAIQNKEIVEKNDVKILNSIKVLEMLNAQILDDTYYVNSNGKIIK